MTWTKLPDEFGQRPMIVTLSDKAYRLNVEGLIYSNRHLTDGLVPSAAVPTLIPEFVQTALDELTTRELWVAGANHSYFLVEFPVHQLSKLEVEALREKRKEAGRLGGLRSAASRKKRGPPTVSPDLGVEQPLKQLLEQPLEQTETPSPSPSPSPRLEPTRGY